ncbi:MAG: 2Fe-2S iron-sulfur cluster-binding protein [Pseudomonadota bacterium]
MTAWLRRLHKWLGLLIGLQFLLWMASGTVMSLLDGDKVSGSLSRMPKSASPPWPSAALPIETVLASQVDPVRSLGTGWLLGKPVLKLSNSKGTRLVDALTGHSLVIDASLARALASASYAGPGDPGPARLLARSSEVRKHKGQVWAVDFSDSDETSVYVSAETGAIVAHRNSTWRLFDFFWMLHIMDYWEREDFNNPLLIGSGIGGLWLALSGIWLLMTSLRLAEFVPKRFRKARSVELYNEDGVKLRMISGREGDTALLALSNAGLQLPSQCGGGQSCGLCVVRVHGQAPAPTSGDIAHIAAVKLAQGYRLACNLALMTDLQLDIPNAASPGKTRTAAVRSIRDVTPSMCEIVLTLEGDNVDDFWPGCYVQIEIPAYEISLAALTRAVGDVHPEVKSSSVINPAPVRRCYSLSRPVSKDKKDVSLLVRFMGGQQAGATQRFGIGSSYMFSLSQGDEVQLTGPFGDFAIRDTKREKIFIGGGAGMGPLRAMLRQLLDSGFDQPIHFWYGARSLAETPYLDEMRTLQRNHANFSWQLVLSEQFVETGEILNGLVHQRADECLLRTHPNLASCEFYLCGPPAMLEATRRMLGAIGVPANEVAFDDFKI